MINTVEKKVTSYNEFVKDKGNNYENNLGLN